MVQFVGGAGIPNLLDSIAALFLRAAPRVGGPRPAAAPSLRLAPPGCLPVAPGDTPSRPFSPPHRPIESRRPVEPSRSVEPVRPVGGGRPSVGRHRKVEVCDADFRLLFVCTGNICRSPFAQILARHLLDGRLGWQAAGQFHVSSAGVQAMAGASMHTNSRTQLSSWQLDTAAADDFVARQLQPAMVASAHLVLGVSTGHRSAVVEQAPQALSTTFGLREFARLASAVDQAALPAEPVARAHAVVEEVRLSRGLAPPVEPGADRVPDPMGLPPVAHTHAAKLIDDALQTIIDVIAPRRRTAPSYRSKGHAEHVSCNAAEGWA